MRNKAVVLLTAIFLFAVALSARAEPVSFAVVSDTHVGAENSVYANFIRIVEKEGIPVIIHTGDATHNPGESSQWEEFVDITGPGKVIHLAPGNHDIQGKKSLAVYLKFFPKSYSSFSEGDTLFVLLNTELPGEEGMVTGKQFAWLEAELRRPFRYKFVFLHEPLFPVLPHHGLDRHKEARDRLHQLFEKEGVALVVAGHDHIYNRSMKGSIIYIIAAGSGGRAQTPEEAKFNFRYILVTRTEPGYSFILKDIDGHTGDEFTVSR